MQPGHRKHTPCFSPGEESLGHTSRVPGLTDTCPNDPGVPGNVAGRLPLGCLVQKGVVKEKCQVYKGL